MQGIVDWLYQQLQVSQAMLNGGRPINDQDKQQMRTFLAICNGNMSKIEALAF